MPDSGFAPDPGAQPATAGRPPLAAIPLREALAVVCARARLLLLAFVLPPLIAAALIVLLPPTYRAQTTLMVKSGREYLTEGTMDGMQGGPTITKLEEINSEMELLRDRAVVEETINRIGLASLYPGILENPPWRGGPMDAAVKKFNANLGISLVKMSNVLDVTFDYPDDREMATTVLDTYIAVYLQRHAAVFASGRAGSFLTSIEQDTADLRRLEQEQARLKLDSRIYDIGPQRATLLGQRAEAAAHLRATNDRGETLQRRIAFLAAARERIPATLSSSEAAPNEEVVQANQALTGLRQSEGALLARHPAEHPEVGRVREQIAAVQRRLGELRATSVKTSSAPAPLAQQLAQELVMDRAELTPLAGEAARYQALLGGYDEELQRLEQADTGVRIMQTRIDALADNLKSIRAQYDIARTQEEMDQRRLASVVPVAPALTPLKPAQPQPLLFAAGGLLLGAFAAGGLAALAVVTNPVFLTAEAVTAQSGLPVLATVALLTGAGRGPPSAEGGPG